MHDAEVCVPGGAFVFGNAATPSSSADLVSSAPPRVAVVPSFRVDMYELTIARYRAVLRAGYTGAKVVLANDLPIPMSAASASAETQPFCTYSTQPMGRETMPLNCMTWSTARGVCQFLGGDLPTEAQWEYVSAQAGRATKTLYPWDDATPTCAQATFARGDDLVTNLPDMCTPLGCGPQPVGSSMDLSADLGVSDLAGGVTEWMLDAAESLASRCWMSAPLEAPFCHFAKPSSYSTRGASWITPFAAPVTLLVTSRSRGLAADNAVTTATGFRCARDGGGPRRGGRWSSRAFSRSRSRARRPPRRPRPSASSSCGSTRTRPCPRRPHPGRWTRLRSSTGSASTCSPSMARRAIARASST